MPRKRVNEKSKNSSIVTLANRMKRKEKQDEYKGEMLVKVTKGSKEKDKGKKIEKKHVYKRKLRRRQFMRESKYTRLKGMKTANRKQNNNHMKEEVWSKKQN